MNNYLDGKPTFFSLKHMFQVSQGTGASALAVDTTASSWEEARPASRRFVVNLLLLSRVSVKEQAELSYASSILRGFFTLAEKNVWKKFSVKCFFGKKRRRK